MDVKKRSKFGQASPPLPYFNLIYRLFLSAMLLYRRRQVIARSYNCNGFTHFRRFSIVAVAKRMDTNVERHTYLLVIDLQVLCYTTL